jgi:hypothetical protein
MDSTQIPKEGQLLVGPLFNEPMLVETVRPGGAAVWTVGLVGSRTHQFRRVQLSEGELALLRIVEASLAPDNAPKRGRKKDVADEALKTRREATTLDRVHAAMLLQSGGRAHALRSLLKSEIERSPDFLRLANSLSALYPKDSEEKRLLDAMLLAVPR